MSVIAEAGPVLRVQVQPAPLAIHVVKDVRTASSTWDMLAAASGGSAYQSRRFLEPWITHVAPALGIEPRLGLVHDERGKAVALLPFGVSRRGPLRAVTYLGGRDSNLNMPLIDPAVSIDADAARNLLRRFAEAISPRPHLFILVNQPKTWCGAGNPFAFADATPSPSAAFGATFNGTADSFLAARDSRDARKKLRSKAARLATLGPISFERVPGTQARDIVALFVAQKEERLAKRGIDAGLDTAHVRAFLGDLSAPADGDPLLEFYTLRVGTTIAAIFGGLAHGRHWHGLINSYDDEPSIARCSPGDLLLRDVLMDLGQRSFQSFDLGIGEARYKAALCETIDLVDTIVPVSLPGHAFAGIEAIRLAAKRWIKQKPAAMKLAQDVRSALFQRNHRQ